ncbi:MAG: hypothetical protein WAO01_15760, partial [Bradyrhizobium sp.]
HLSLSFLFRFETNGADYQWFSSRLFVGRSLCVHVMISELWSIQARICQADLGQQCKLPFSFIGTARTQSRCYGVPMKGNNMTNQNQPGQQNQAPGQKPGQQGGGSKPGQQSQAPGKDNRNPKEQLDQTSDTDT